jgi:UDP-N-acetylmuramyl pentapeptide phosphotransferase/UDP-N-acetylglucosamine-1-phosphate transferase
MLCHFVGEALRPPTVHVIATRIGTNGETMRNWQVQHAHHFSQIGSLSTQKIFVLHWWATMFMVEGKNV